MLTLDVHIESVASPVGKLTRQADGSSRFRYLQDGLPHPVSLGLPIREEPFGDAATRGFFANLLFENAMLDQVIRRHRIERGDFVGLLYHLGADCPGALSCTPEGAAAPKSPGLLSQDYDPLTAADLTRIMTALRDHRRLPATQADPSPLAGVQGKIALTQMLNGGFALPKPDRGVPTTHILKVPRPGHMHEVHQEHRALQAMAAFQDHPVAKTTPIGDGDLQGLLIDRFDRVVEGDRIRRLHQEDFCQALGLSAELKYERRAAEPGMRFDAKAMGGIIARTARPGVNRLALFQITLANLLLGNTDNHAKNHALLYRGPVPDLAPVYDVIPTIIDPEVTHELAFRIGRARMTDELQRTDLVQFARDLGMRSFTSGHKARLCQMLTQAFDGMGTLRGPVGKRLRDVLAEQGRHLNTAAECNLHVPEGDLIVINRP